MFCFCYDRYVYYASWLPRRLCRLCARWAISPFFLFSSSYKYYIISIRKQLRCQKKNQRIRVLKYMLLAACSYIVWHYSFSSVISLTLQWVILGIIISLLILFLLWDYGIKKREISKFNRILWIISLVVTVLFSIWIFYLKKMRLVYWGLFASFGIETHGRTYSYKTHFEQSS